MSGQPNSVSTGARFRRGITALFILCGLLVGVPAILLSVGGDPLPHHIASLHQIGHDLTSTDPTGHLFLGVALLVAWAGWAAFALSVLLEIVGRLRQRPTLRIPGLAYPRRAAAGLFTAIAIMVSTGGMSAAAFAGTPVTPPAAVAIIGNPVPLNGPHGAASTLVYQVKPGDTLGGIAQRFLGHFDDYPQIVAANSELISHANHIQPGWTLHLPSSARDRGVRTHASGVLSSTLANPGNAGVTVTIAEPAPPTAAPPTTAAPSTGPGGITRTVTTVGGSPARPAGAATVQPGGIAPLVTFGAVAPVTPSEASTPIPNPAASPILVASALGLTTGVLGAHLMLWSRRRRSSGRGAAATPAVTMPDTDETTTSIELNRLDLALRDLASLLGDRPQDEMPDIMGSWTADGNVHLMLTEPCPAPPAPWLANGLMWTLPAHVPTNSYFAGTTAPLPALVTVGGGDDRRVLLDLERLGVVTIGGDHAGASDLLRHVGAELTHGIWSDDVTIGIAGFDEADTRRLTTLGRGRVRASNSIADALDDAGRWINEAHERLAGFGVNNVFSGRISATPAEARRLSPYALLIADPDADDLERLERVDAYLEGRGRGQLAIATTQKPGTRVVAGRKNMGRWPLTVDADRTVTMEFLDARIPAVALDEEELANLADASTGVVRAAAQAVASEIPVGRHRAHNRRQTVG
ncbi:MAG TPA: LysM peptidoglycan-binding domain-containing protein [Micromonosporaceae bacterium]